MGKPKHPTKPIDQRIARAIVEEATERAERSGPHNCLIWPDRLDANGYGVTAWLGGVRSHRLAYSAAYHDPGDLMVRHEKCGNPSCFDYLHLSEGTAADNMADTIRMGRHSNKPSVMTAEMTAEAVALIDEGYSITAVASTLGVGFGTVQRAVKGKKDPTITTGRHVRKVSDDDVLRSRREFAAGHASMREIADTLGISWPAAQKMIQGRTYKHIGEAIPGAKAHVPRVPESCAVDGCAATALARGLCTMHYNRVINGGQPGPAEPRRAKLDEEKVRAIRRMRSGGAKIKDIAAEVGVGHSTIEGVLSRRTWAHVTDDDLGS